MPAGKTNLLRLSYQPPPWVADPLSRDFWVKLPIAGEYYFRRSYKTMRAMLERGTFEDIFDVYFDGSRWWIKLPVVLEDTQKST